MSKKNQRRYKSPLNLVNISRCSGNNMHARTIAANMIAVRNERVIFYFVSFACFTLSFTINLCASCVFCATNRSLKNWSTIICEFVFLLVLLLLCYLSFAFAHFIFQPMQIDFTDNTADFVNFFLLLICNQIVQSSWKLVCSNFDQSKYARSMSLFKLNFGFGFYPLSYLFTIYSFVHLWYSHRLPQRN